MLAELPPQEAARLLAEVERLGEIDPEEQRGRAGGVSPHCAPRGARTSDAVEFTYSAPASRQAVAANERHRSSGRRAVRRRPAVERCRRRGAMAGAACRTSIRRPSRRRSSRLGDEQGAAVFAALPAELQAEVLDRLARLAAGGRRARCMEVESQLAAAGRAASRSDRSGPRRRRDGAADLGQDGADTRAYCWNGLSSLDGGIA